jgi:hypothetical protein
MDASFLAKQNFFFFCATLIMALDETTPVTVTGDDDSTTAQPLHPVTHWEQLNEVWQYQFSFR